MVVFDKENASFYSKYCNLFMKTLSNSPKKRSIITRYQNDAVDTVPQHYFYEPIEQVDKVE